MKIEKLEDYIRSQMYDIDPKKRERIISRIILKLERMKDTKKYYLVSYAHSEGFGNIFFEVGNEELNIREAEKEIQKISNFTNKPTIITINKIKKSQFVKQNENK